MFDSKVSKSYYIFVAILQHILAPPRINYDPKEDEFVTPLEALRFSVIESELVNGTEKTR